MSITIDENGHVERNVKRAKVEDETSWADF